VSELSLSLTEYIHPECKQPQDVSC